MLETQNLQEIKNTDTSTEAVEVLGNAGENTTTTLPDGARKRAPSKKQHLIKSNTIAANLSTQIQEGSDRATNEAMVHAFRELYPFVKTGKLTVNDHALVFNLEDFIKDASENNETLKEIQKVLKCDLKEITQDIRKNSAGFLEKLELLLAQQFIPTIHKSFCLLFNQIAKLGQKDEKLVIAEDSTQNEDLLAAIPINTLDAFKKAGQSTVTPFKNQVVEFISEYSTQVQLDCPIEEIKFQYSNDCTLTVTYILPLSLKIDKQLIPLGVKQHCETKFTADPNSGTSKQEESTAFSYTENDNESFVTNLRHFHKKSKKDSVDYKNFLGDYFHKKIKDFIPNKIQEFEKNSSEELSDDLINLFFTLVGFYDLKDLREETKSLAKQIVEMLKKAGQIHILFGRKFQETLKGSPVALAHDVISELTDNPAEDTQQLIYDIANALQGVVSRDGIGVVFKQKVENFIDYLVLKSFNNIDLTNSSHVTLLQSFLENNRSVLALKASTLNHIQQCVQKTEDSPFKAALANTLVTVISHYCPANTQKAMTELSQGQASLTALSGHSTDQRAIRSANNQIDSAKELLRDIYIYIGPLTSEVGEQIKEILAKFIELNDLKFLINPKNPHDFLATLPALQEIMDELIPELTQSTKNLDALVNTIVDFTTTLRQQFADTENKAPVLALAAHLESQLFETIKIDNRIQNKTLIQIYQNAHEHNPKSAISKKVIVEITTRQQKESSDEFAGILTAHSVTPTRKLSTVSATDSNSSLETSVTKSYSKKQEALRALYKDFSAKYSIDEAAKLVPLVTFDYKTSGSPLDNYLETRNSSLHIKWNGFLNYFGIKTTWTKFNEFDTANPTLFESLIFKETKTSDSTSAKTKSTYNNCLGFLFKSKKSTTEVTPQATITPTTQTPAVKKVLTPEEREQNLKAAKTIPITTCMRYIFGINPPPKIDLPAPSAGSAPSTPTPETAPTLGGSSSE